MSFAAPCSIASRNRLSPARSASGGGAARPIWTAWSLVVANAGSSETPQDDAGAWPRLNASIREITYPCYRGLQHHVPPKPWRRRMARILHELEPMSLTGLVDPAQQEVVRE